MIKRRKYVEEPKVKKIQDRFLKKRFKKGEEPKEKKRYKITCRSKDKKTVTEPKEKKEIQDHVKKKTSRRTKERERNTRSHVLEIRPPPPKNTGKKERNKRQGYHELDLGSTFPIFSWLI